MKSSLLTAFQAAFESPALDDTQSAIGLVDEETLALDEVQELREKTAETDATCSKDSDMSSGSPL